MYHSDVIQEWRNEGIDNFYNDIISLFKNFNDLFESINKIFFLDIVTFDKFFVEMIENFENLSFITRFNKEPNTTTKMSC